MKKDKESTLKETRQYIMPISISQLDDEDIKWLDKAVKNPYYGYNSSHIIADVVLKNKQLWRLRKGRLRGIMITTVIQHPAVKELRIWGVGGIGYARYIKEIYKGLTQYASLHNCASIVGTVLNRKLEKVYESVGAKSIGAEFKVEIN